MSDLIVLGFDGMGTADEVLTKLRALKKEHLIDLEDACVVIRGQDGKVQVKQAVNLTALGAASGMSTGMLVGGLAGLLLLNPLAGMAVGGLMNRFGALQVPADCGSMMFIRALANLSQMGPRLCSSW
jgi:uncharacterized membrane protein